MTRLREILRDRKGNGFPLAIAITLALVIIFCGISEYIRLLIIAQGVRDAVQTAVISTVNDNYDDVYTTRRFHLISGCRLKMPLQRRNWSRRRQRKTRKSMQPFIFGSMAMTASFQRATARNSWMWPYGCAIMYEEALRQ